MAEQQEHSLVKRYAFKVFSSLANLVLGFAVAGIVPRALGVKSFGDYSYLTTFFQRMAGFLDFRTSTYFYVRLSQDRSNKSLTVFYAYYTFLIIVSMLVLTAILALTPLRNMILPNQLTRYIFLAALAGLLSWMLDLFASVMDAYGYTLVLEKMRFVNKLFSVALVLSMNYLGQLNYANFFFYQYVIAFPILFFITVYLIRKGQWIGLSFHVPTDVRKALIRDFVSYSTPLFSYTAISFGVVIFDRWLLQVYGGSSAQGLYAFAFGFMTYGYLFTNAIQPLMVREMSVAVNAKDENRMVHLYNKFYPVLFAITAYFCAFLFVEADQIVAIFGGDEFANAATPLRILLLYPLINVFSGLNTAVILSVQKTKLFFYLSLIFAPIGCIALFFLVCSSFLDLGATGLAIKIIGLECISLVIVTFLIRRSISINPSKSLLHFLFLLIFISIAFGTRFSIEHAHISAVILVNFFLSGFLYTAFILLVAFLSPVSLGISRSTFDDGYVKVRNSFTRIIKR